MKWLARVLLAPVGFVDRLIGLAVDGSRDWQYKLRFAGAIVDRGCWIDPSSTVERGARLYERCIFLRSSLGRFSYLGRNCLVQNAQIGSFCSIANDVFIGLGRHPLTRFSTSPVFYRARNPLGVSVVDEDLNFEEYDSIRIGHDVWVGARATVMDGVTVGTGAVIAAHAVVTKDVPPYAVVAGVPARVISQRFSEDRQRELLASKWWEWPLEQIRQRLIDDEPVSI